MSLFQVWHLLRPIATILAVAGPAGAAVSASNDDLNLSIGVQIQARIDADRSKDGQGSNNSVETGNDNTLDPAANFYARRVRLVFKAMYQQVWGFNLTFRDDGAGYQGTNAGLAASGGAAPPVNTGSAGGSGSPGATPSVNQAFIYRLFRNDGFTQQIQVGQDYAWHNRVANVETSTELLLPNVGATNALLNSRAFGVGYRLTSTWVSIGADIQNNIAHTGGQAGPAVATGNEDRAEGLFYSARIEVSPSGSWHIAKDTESFAGRQGQGVRVGADIAYNEDARTVVAPSLTANNSQSTIDYGIDGLFHIDGLTALAESRWDRISNRIDSGSDPGTTNKHVWLVQAGYTFRVGDGIAIEPAARFELIDLKRNTIASDIYNYSGSYGDWGNDGSQIDVGVNFYWAGHASKTQLEFTRWSGNGYGNTALTGPARNGTTDAKATILRLQQQIAF